MAVLSSVAACASGGHQRVAYSPADRYLHVRDSVEALNAANVAESAPQIRLYVPPGSNVSSYVDVSFHVDDDAYALVVAVDLDRRVRVLFPESPADTGFVTNRAQARLQRFFAGFGQPVVDARYRYLQGGVVVGIASARPLQLDRLRDDSGAWNEDAIARLLDYASVYTGAYQLGRVVTLTGQDFTTDNTGFAGRIYGSFASLRGSRYYADCTLGYASYYSPAFSPAYGDYGYESAPLVRYFRANGTLYAQYQLSSRCGQAVYSAPIPLNTLPQTPRPPHDTTTTDSTGSNGRHPIPPGRPRFPSVTGERATSAMELRFRAPERVLDPAAGTARMRMRAEESTPFRGHGRMIDDGSDRMQPMPAATQPRPVEARPKPAERPVQQPERRAEPVRELPRLEPARPEPAHGAPAREPIDRRASPRVEPNGQ